MPSPATPTPTKLIEPLPALRVRPNALLVVPNATLPFAALVLMLRLAAKVVVREVPLRSTAPSATISPLSVFAPVP